MKYERDQAGNRVVVATPEEVRSFRPSVRACLRRWKARDVDLEDFCQETEIIVWKALTERRINGNRFEKPVNAFLDFLFATAWNLWRNHSRKRATRLEVLSDEIREAIGPDPEGRLDARETLRQIATRGGIAQVLLDAVNLTFAERLHDLPHGTYCSKLAKARSWARDVDAGQWREPKQAARSTWKQRKKSR